LCLLVGQNVAAADLTTTVKPVEERRARSEEQHPAASIWRQEEAKITLDQCLKLLIL
jgi:hypothetical protein